MTQQDILDKLPYTEPFLFVDELLRINADGIEGRYCFDSNSHFYQGHFKGNPVTPGVILTECCAQIGLVCLGVYLLGQAEVDDRLNSLQIAFIQFRNGVLVTGISGRNGQSDIQKGLFQV